MHVKKDNIEESDRLIDFIIIKALAVSASIVFSGDQYNDHSIVHTAVLDFWKRTYFKLSAAGIKSYSLVGNHDLSSDYKHSPMYVHSDYTDVVLEPKMISPSVGCIGYIKNHDDFGVKVMGLYNAGARLIFCHAEFDGASFDNGFYIPNGIKVSDFPTDLTFVSGHIHSKQELTQNGVIRVYYPGTPRMLTRSDLSKEKTLMVIDTLNRYFGYIAVPADVCEPFRHIIVTSLADLESVTPSDRLYVDVKGTKDFINTILEKLPGNVKVRTIPDTEKMVENVVNETDGINTAFANYLMQYATDQNLNQNEFLTKVYEYLPSWRN